MIRYFPSSPRYTVGGNRICTDHSRSAAGSPASGHGSTAQSHVVIPASIERVGQVAFSPVISSAKVATGLRHSFDRMLTLNC